MKGKFTRIALLGLTVLTALFVFPFSKPQTAQADSFSVIPPRFELFGNPGDTIVDKIRIKNGSDTNETYQMQVEDFKAQGDEGGVALIDPGSPSTTFSLATWITVDPPRITIAPGEESTVNYTIRIPRNGEPGGHYASVLARRAGQGSPGAAAVDTRVGSLILLRVSGNVTEKAHVESFRAQESYAQHGPVTFVLRSANDGNVHVQPSGTIVITNMFGRKVTEIPLTQANILPGSSRNITTTWDAKNPIGRYTATLVATYGQSKETLSATTSFIVFPLYLLVIILAIILVLFLLITQRKKVRRIINRITSD